MLTRLCLVLCLILISLTPTLGQNRPAFDPLLSRAEKAIADNDLEQAVMLYEKLANFYPNSSLAHNRLGYAHYLRGNDSRAIYSFQQALALDRNNDQALHNLLLASGRQADLLAQRNSFSESTRVLDDLISTYSWHPQHAVLLYYKGRVAFLRGRPQEALALWKRAAAQAPSSGVAKVVKAQSSPLNDHTIELYRKANEQVTSEPGFDYLLGKRQLDAQQYDNAYKNLKIGLEKARAAELPFPLLSLAFAQAALASDHGSEAIDVLEEAKKQRPDWASIRTLLWPTYLTAGDHLAADAALQESFELDKRPKLALLGAPDPVRLTTANGSLLLVPPTATSLPAGRVTLTPKGGTAQTLEINEGQALVMRLQGTELVTESSATLAASVGNAGQLAPPLVAKDRRGRLYRLAQHLLKRPIVILFWDVTDPESSRQLAELGAIASRLEDNVETVAVHMEPSRQKDAQQLYLSQPGTSAQLWGESKMADEFGVTEIPTVVVINQRGYITSRRSGGAVEMFQGLALSIEEMLDEND